jgi:hypothetical protein
MWHQKQICTCIKCNGGPGVMWILHDLCSRYLYSLVDVLICMGHVFAGCQRELKNSAFLIIDDGCCPFLKRLEGNKNSYVYIFISFCVLNFWFVYNSAKELRNAIREDPETHDFVKRGVRIHRNEVQKVGFLGWLDEMCADTVQL